MSDEQKLPLAFSYADSGIARAQKSSDCNLRAYSLITKGDLYSYINDFNTALDYCENASKLLKNGGTHSMQISVLVSKGTTLFTANEMKRAEQAFRAALDIYMKHPDDEEVLSDLYNNIGSVCGAQQKFDEASEYFSRSLRINQKRKDNYSIAYSLNNLATVETSLGNLQKAKEYFEAALELKKAFASRYDVAAGYRRLGDLHIRMNDYRSAISCLDKCLQYIDTNIYSLELRKAYDNLAVSHEYFGNLKEANRYNKLLKRINEKIFEQQLRTELTQKDAMLEFSKVHIRDSLLTANKLATQAKDIKTSNTVRGFLISIVVIIVISFALVWKRYRISLAQKAEIAMQKQEIQHKQQELTDSIKYARRIQLALITSEKNIEKALKRLNRRSAG